MAVATFPFFESPNRGGDQGIKLLIKKGYLKAESVKAASADGAFRYRGFLFEISAKPKKPLLLITSGQELRGTRLLVGLTDGQILEFDLSDPKAEKELEKYIPKTFLANQSSKQNELLAQAKLQGVMVAQAFLKKDKPKAAWELLKKLDREGFGGARFGYVFKLTLGELSAVGSFRWSLTAAPKIPGKTGARWFYLDDSLGLRSSTKGPAGPDSELFEDPDAKGQGKKRPKLY